MNVYDTMMAVTWFIFIVALSGITVYSLFSGGDDDETR